MRISKLASLACGVAFVLAEGTALADIAIDDDGVTVSFTDFTAAGFAATPSAGQLSSNDWSITGFSDGDLNFGGNNTAPDYKRGVPAGMLANLTEGGIYAFSNAANPMFGVLQSAEDFTPGTITARFKSSVAHPLVKLAVSYKIMAYNKGTRADSLNFSWSTDNVTYTAIAALDYTTTAAAAGSPAWETVNRTTTLTVNIPQNGYLYLRWSGNDGGGTGTTYDLLGLDDITVTPQNGCGDGVAAGTESCDDGNQSNADLCLNTCEQASCGDGYIRTTGTPEQCDPGIQGTQCCNSCLKTTGNACTASGNRPGTCNVGTCVANPTQGSGGEGGEPSGGGAGGETNGGESNGGEPSSTGGTGNRGGRGPGAGSGGMTAGQAGTGTAGTATAGTAGTGTAGTTANGGTSGGGAPSGGKSGAGGSGGSAGSTGGTSAGKAGSGGTGSTKPPASGSDDDGGCGCSVPRSSNHASLALAMLGALAAFARRRRRG